ncbi:MAG: hypothetical protein V4726_11060 [Verrucomicrobiota bacterium]
MTPAIFITAVRSVLSDSLGSDCNVSAADDEFTAMEVLTGAAPQRVRVVIICGELTAVEGDGMGMVCRLSTRVVVQVARGLSINATAAAQLKLLEAEETARRWVLSLMFHQEGTDPPDRDMLAKGQGLHPHVGQFEHQGSGAYQGPYADIALEHPAREIRFSNLIALESPVKATHVPLPL